MKKVTFDKKPTNFFLMLGFCKKFNHDPFNLLQQAVEQNVLFDKNQELLLNFINFIKNKDIKSQLFQEMFASFIIENNYQKTFLEFGATDGVRFSNSYILEKNENWTGILGEPNIDWHKDLKINRPNTKIIKECIWSESNVEIDFFASGIKEFSTISSFVESDKLSMPINTKERTSSGRLVKLRTISLNDLIERDFDSKAPSYISIDTEGSEYEILNTFDFNKYRSIVFTVEHNYTSMESKLDKLMFKNNYVRMFEKLTAFDAWYVAKEAINI
jgi:FkbM family methyltransferase